MLRNTPFPPGFKMICKPVALLFQTIIFALLISICLPSAAVASVDFAERLNPRDVEALPADRETVHGISEAVLVIPRADVSVSASDPKEQNSYSTACYVYLDENGLLIRRFTVHVPDREALPYARRAGRMLALIWGSANRRFGNLASGLRRTTVDVWMTRAGEPGGEQLRNSIYIYNFMAPRISIEWARELAHEYGHYLLPGASGYTSPENWSNGVLGERLFLKWLGEDISAGRFPEKEMPFVKEPEMNEYREKQITPLITRMQAAGPDIALLQKRDKPAMDAFTALLLYADETYGSASIMDLLDYLPQSAAAGAHAEDFLNALVRCLSDRPSLNTRLSPKGSATLFLPKGTYLITTEGSAPTSLAVGKGASVSKSENGWKVTLSTPAWRLVSVQPSDKPFQLHWERQ
jgi:hypothetical protein